MKTKGVPRLALGFLIPSLILNIFLLMKTFNGNNNNSKVYIRDVIDGDTLVTKTGSKIRLLRVDAPELEFCLGE